MEPTDGSNNGNTESGRGTLEPGQFLKELREWKIPKVKREFGRLKHSDKYGSVLVTIDSKEYTVRCGTREWRLAEQRFDCKTIQQVIAAVNSGEENTVAFYQILLSRHHDVDEIVVSDLMDWSDLLEDGTPAATLKDAVELALHYSKPYLFPGEEDDPKALADISTKIELYLVALMNQTKPSE